MPPSPQPAAAPPRACSRHPSRRLAGRGAGGRSRSVFPPPPNTHTLCSHTAPSLGAGRLRRLGLRPGRLRRPARPPPAPQRGSRSPCLHRPRSNNPRRGTGRTRRHRHRRRPRCNNPRFAAVSRTFCNHKVSIHPRAPLASPRAALQLFYCCFNRLAPTRRPVDAVGHQAAGSTLGHKRPIPRCVTTSGPPEAVRGAKTLPHASTRVSPSSHRSLATGDPAPHAKPHANPPIQGGGRRVANRATESELGRAESPEPPAARAAPPPKTP